jgi:hypothetical protein
MMRIGKQAGCVCLVVGALVVMCGCSGRAVVPSSYDTFKVEGGAFQILCPAGWEASGAGGPFPWAKFTSGSAAIEVDTALVGSLIGDIAQAQNNMSADDSLQAMRKRKDAPDLCPARAAHDFEKEEFANDFGVKEQAPVPAQTGFGEARMSEFTGSRMGSAIHGCRVTALSPDKRYRIVCRCSESQWETLKPVFDKVIKSVAKGSGT